MAQPTPYVKSQTFANIQSGNTLAPIPGSDFDVEFGLVQITVGQILANLAVIQKDDTTLANGVVTPLSLNAATIAMMGVSGWSPKGAWVTSTAYNVRDFVTQAGSNYVCIATHTAGTFSTDLAAGKWQLVASTGMAGTNGATGSGYTATSTSSLTVGTGSTTFATQSGLAYSVGARVRASSASSPTAFMEGTVTSYSGVTMIVNVDTTSGSGTKADWNINLAGNVGQQGAQGAQGVPGPSGQNTNGGVRQTVAAGPVDTNGLPTFLPASATGLSLTTQNITSPAPLAVTAANNNSGANGTVVDRSGASTSNLTWNGLTNSATNYLYVTVNSDGSLTASSTTLVPIYQWGGAPSTTAGQFTFNIGEMRGYLGNGTTAPQSYAVFVGEAVASGGNVSSTVAYAYNGQYESGFTATLPGASTATNASHNIGVMPRVVDFMVECTTTDNGYATGDQLGLGSLGSTTTTTAMGVVALTRTAKTMGLSTGASSAFFVVPKAGGSHTALTAANWKYKFAARRGW